MVLAAYAPAAFGMMLLKMTSLKAWLVAALAQALIYSTLGASHFRGWVAVVGIVILAHFVLAFLLLATVSAAASV